MSDRFIKFNDEQLDAKQVMMLQDLARLLLKNEQTQVKIQKFPYYNPYSNTLIASWFWSHRPKHIEQAGLKTDVLLATYGYLNMDLSIINQVLHNNDFEHPKFFHQLFKLLEDVRIFEHIRQQRPSTTDTINPQAVVKHANDTIIPSKYFPKVPKPFFAIVVSKYVPIF